jgi:TolB-like protein
MDQHAFGSPPRNFRLLECTVDRALGRIAHPEGATHVEPRVMDVLLALVRSAGNAASRDDIIQSAWGHPHVTDEALSRCISLLRQALRDDRRKPRYIETIPKRGYRLLAPIESAVAKPLHIAVLPFLNLSSDAGYQYLADGLTELLITHVSCLPALRVVSRTSSMRYQHSRLRLPEIARELNVSRVVEGSVFASTRSVQAVMQLIDPSSDTHVVARSYMRDFADVIQIQNDLASSMAKAVEAAVAS